MAQSFKKVKIETDQKQTKVGNDLGVKSFKDPTDSKVFLDSNKIMNENVASEPGSIDRLATQKDNLEARIQAVNQKYDPRNTVQKLLGLKQNHGIISGTLDLLVRPLGVVKSGVNELINPSEQGFTGAIMAGIKGDGRDLNWVSMAGLDTGHLDGFTKFLMNFGLDIAADPLTWLPAGAMWKGMKKVGATVKDSQFFQSLGKTVLGDAGYAKLQETAVNVANSFGGKLSFMYGSNKEVKELVSVSKATQSELEQQVFSFVNDIHTLRKESADSLYRYIKHGEVPNPDLFPNLVKYAEGKEKTVRQTLDEMLEYMGIRNYESNWKTFVKEKYFGNEAEALNDRITWLTGLNKSGVTVDEFMLRKATEFLNVRYGREFGIVLPDKADIRKLIGGYQKEFEAGLKKEFELLKGIGGKERIERAYAEYIGRAAFSEGVGSVDKRTVENVMKAIQSPEGAFFAIDPNDGEAILDLLEELHFTVDKPFDKQDLAGKIGKKVEINSDIPQPKPAPKVEKVNPQDKAIDKAIKSIDKQHAAALKKNEAALKRLEDLKIAANPDKNVMKIQNMNAEQRTEFFKEFPEAETAWKQFQESDVATKQITRAQEEVKNIRQKLDELHTKRKKLETIMVERDDHYGSFVDRLDGDTDLLEIYDAFNQSDGFLRQARTESRFINNWNENWKIYSSDDPAKALNSKIQARMNEILKTNKPSAISEANEFAIKRTKAYQAYEKYFTANKVTSENVANLKEAYKNNFRIKWTDKVNNEKFASSTTLKKNFYNSTFGKEVPGKDTLSTSFEKFTDKYGANSVYEKKYKQWQLERHNFKKDLLAITDPKEYARLNSRTNKLLTETDLKSISKEIHKNAEKEVATATLAEQQKISDNLKKDIKWLKQDIANNREAIQEYTITRNRAYLADEKADLEKNIRLLNEAEANLLLSEDAVRELTLAQDANQKIVGDTDLVTASQPDVEEISKFAEELAEWRKIKEEIKALNKGQAIQEEALASVSKRTQSAPVNWTPSIEHDKAVMSKIKKVFEDLGETIPNGAKTVEDYQKALQDLIKKQEKTYKKDIANLNAQRPIKNEWVDNYSPKTHYTTLDGRKLLLDNKELASELLFTIESTEDYGLKHYKALENIDSQAWQKEPHLRELINYYGNIENVKDAFLANKGKGITIKWNKDFQGGRISGGYIDTEIWLRKVEQTAKEEAYLKITQNFEEYAKKAAEKGITLETFPVDSMDRIDGAFNKLLRKTGTNWNKVFRTEANLIKAKTLNRTIEMPQFILTRNIGYRDQRFIDSIHVLNNTMYRFIESKGFTPEFLETSSYLKNITNPEQTMLAGAFRALHTPGATKAAQMTKLDKTLKGTLPSSVLQDTSLYSADVMNKILGFDLYASDQVLAIARQAQVLPEQFSFWSIIRDSISTGTEFNAVSESTRLATDLLGRSQPVNKLGRTYIKVGELKEKLEFYRQFVPQDDWLLVENMFESIYNGGATVDAFNPEKTIAPQYVEISIGLKDLIERPAKTTQEVSALGDFIAKITKPWKSTLLVTPGYHHRNVISNALNANAAGLPMIEYSAKYFDATTDVLNVQNSLKKLKDGVPKNAQKFNHFRTVEDFNSYAKSILSEKDFTLWNDYVDLTKRGVVNQSRISSDFWDYINSVGTVGKKNKWHQNSIKKIFDGNMHIGQITDDAARLATYRMGVNNPKYYENLGLSSPDSLVKFVHFDYNALTEFEKGVMKKWIPFYTWSRKNLEFQIKATLMRPERVTRVQKFLNGMYSSQFAPEELKQNELPEWIQDNMWFPIRGKNGKIKYLKINPPVQDFIDLGNLKILSRINPFYKIMFETMTGADLFNNQNTSLTKSTYNNLLSPFTKFLVSPFDIPVGQIPLGGGKNFGNMLGQDINYLEKNSIWFTQDIETLQKSYYWEQINGMSSFVKYLKSEGFSVPDAKDLIKNQTIPKAITMAPLKNYKVKKLAPLKFK